MSAPIKHTCPDIDKALKYLKSARQQLANNLDDTDIRWINGDLDSVESILEDLRSSNDSLRSWGHDLEKEIEELNEQMGKMIIPETIQSL